MNKEVIIIGAGPAGVSAALYTTRAGLSTTILTRGGGALSRASSIENYYGFPTPISGAALEEAGLAGAVRLGARCIQEEVIDLAWEGDYRVTTTGGVYRAGAVILATGAARSAPPIPGIERFEGAGVSYCAVCDAFFFRGRKVAVLGAGPYALHEAGVLAAVAEEVTLLTQGEEVGGPLPANVRIEATKLTALHGEEALAELVLADGRRLAADGLFVALGVAGVGALARKVGAVLQGQSILVDEQMATTLPGLYAAGDCVGGLLQIAKAVYDGARAGLAVQRYMRERAQ